MPRQVCNNMPRSPGLHVVLAVTIAMTTACIPPAHGTVYKWVDDQGITHYSQTPPPAKQFNTVEPPPPPAQDPQQAAKKLQEMQQSMDEKRQARDEQAKQQDQRSAELEADRKACQEARKRLEVLQSHGRIRAHSPDGESRILTPEQRQAHIAKTRQVIAGTCSN